jgi:hypothetical protein
MYLFCKQILCYDVLHPLRTPMEPAWDANKSLYSVQHCEWNWRTLNETEDISQLVHLTAHTVY